MTIMNLKILLMLLAGPIFLFGLTGYLIVRRKLRPGDKELEETWYESEDRHPAIDRYETWRRITLGLVVLSMLLLFLAVVL